MGALARLSLAMFRSPDSCANVGAGRRRTRDHTRPTAQPYGELGLKDDEYRRDSPDSGPPAHRHRAGHVPVMWSEHCSHKSSKVHLRYCRPPPTMRAAMLAGIGENAGVVDIGDGRAYHLRVESHNYLS